MLSNGLDEALAQQLTDGCSRKHNHTIRLSSTIKISPTIHSCGNIWCAREQLVCNPSSMLQVTLWCMLARMQVTSCSAAVCNAPAQSSQLLLQQVSQYPVLWPRWLLHQLCMLSMTSIAASGAAALLSKYYVPALTSCLTAATESNHPPATLPHQLLLQHSVN